MTTFLLAASSAGVAEQPMVGLAGIAACCASNGRPLSKANAKLTPDVFVMFIISLLNGRFRNDTAYARACQRGTSVTKREREESRGAWANRNFRCAALATMNSNCTP